MLQWTLGCMCLFELWFSQGICPVVGLLGHMVVLVILKVYFILTTLDLFWIFSVYSFIHPTNQYWMCDICCTSTVVDWIIGPNVFTPSLHPHPYHGLIMRELYASFDFGLGHVTCFANDIWKKVIVLSQGLRGLTQFCLLSYDFVIPLP